MKFRINSEVFVRLVRGTSERMSITATQKKMFGSTGTIVKEFENGYFLVKHGNGEFLWHESSLALDRLATSFGIKP